jgi:SNF2 family DNA or RNA helicase
MNANSDIDNKYDEKYEITNVSYGFNSLNINNNDDQKEMQKIWDSYPRIEQPDNLSIQLFPHQLVTVYNMEKLERVRKIKQTSTSYFMTDFGILGDIPGYGKSFSIVSLILRDKMPWDITMSQEKVGITTINGFVNYVSNTKYKRIRPNLIVVSPTLVEQWKSYFSFAKDGILSIFEVSTRKHLESLNANTINNWDVVLCSSIRYNDLIDHIGNQYTWKRFIFDEAGSTHIPAMRSVQSGFMWFVSATYDQLLNVQGSNVHFMRRFFNSINYDILKYFVIRNSVEFVKQSFKMPEVFHETHLCLNPRLLNVLSSYIDQESNMMISAGDIKGAILRIGGGMTSETNLFEVVSKKQKEKLDTAKFSLAFWKNKDQTHSTVKAEVADWENRVKAIEKNMEELKLKYDTILEDDCSICYSTINRPIMLPCCQNVFCGQCVMKWLDTNKTCPMCRADIKPKDLVYINKKEDDDGDSKCDEKVKEFKRPKTKPQTVCDIVSTTHDANGNLKKYLIFSMYDSTFDLIRRELVVHHINFVEISGTKTTRDSKLKRFKDGDVNIVFLNSRFNGAGINLEMATDIILYHEMPPSIEEQVIGRALRIGRQGNVTVHHLCIE